jgi:hypothetical protein
MVQEQLKTSIYGRRGRTMGVGRILATTLLVACAFLSGEAKAVTIGAIIQGDTLYRVDDSNPNTALSTGWSGATSMAIGGAWYYVITGGAVWRASTSDGSWSLVNDEGWGGATEMAWNVSTGKLYIIQDGRLWRMNDAANNGTYAMVNNTNWSGTSSMTSLGASLYVIQNGTLYKVNPTNGSRVVLGTSGDWSGDTRMTIQTWGGGLAAAKLYIVQGSTLHSVNPSTGAYTVIGSVGWWPATTTMFCDSSGAFTSDLYIVDDARLYRVDSVGNYVESSGAIWTGPIVSAGFACSW